MKRHQRSRTARLAVVGLVAVMGSGCASVSTAGNAAANVRVVLDRQVHAWNEGDIETYMAGYWKSDDLTFVSGGDVTRGWQATLDRYRRRYPDREAMGRLRFDELEVRELGPDAALVLGRWQLERDSRHGAAGGRFTLVFRRIRGEPRGRLKPGHAGWVIVHDHTSVE